MTSAIGILNSLKSACNSEDKEVKAASLTRSLLLFSDMMKLLHPFMPFISEEIVAIIR